MKRRTMLRRSGLGVLSVGIGGISGCIGDDGTDDDGTGEDSDPSEPLPQVSISDQTLRSTVEELSVDGYQTGLRRGQRHEDIHFAVTLSITNTGDQQTDLEDYGYEMTLYDRAGTDVTPGDTWTSDGDTIAPGETGQILVEVSFLDSQGSPEDIDSYRIVVGCSGSSAYC